MTDLQYLVGAGFGIRRDLHSLIGGFDETLMASQDGDYGYRAQLAGARGCFARNAVMHYRLRLNMRSAFRQGIVYGRDIAFLQWRYHRGRVTSGVRGSWLRYWFAWLQLISWVIKARYRAEHVLIARNAGFFVGMGLACIDNKMKPGLGMSHNP